MSLFIFLSNLLCLLLPTLAFAHVTTPEDPVNVAAHHVKRLSNPLRNLLHKRDAIPVAGGANSTNAILEDSIAFENTIDIPGQGQVVYFLVCQTARMIEIDLGDSANLSDKGQGRSRP